MKGRLVIDNSVVKQRYENRRSTWKYMYALKLHWYWNVSQWTVLYKSAQRTHLPLPYPDRNYCKSFFEASFFHSNASLDRKNLEAVKIFIVDTYKTEKAL